MQRQSVKAAVPPRSILVYRASTIQGGPALRPSRHKICRRRQQPIKRNTQQLEFDLENVHGQQMRPREIYNSLPDIKATETVSLATCTFSAVLLSLHCRRACTPLIFGKARAQANYSSANKARLLLRSLLVFFLKGPKILFFGPDEETT